MAEEDCNFLERRCRTDFIHFRKRVISLIFATDMTKHAEMINSLKQVVSIRDIKNEEDVSKWLLNDKDWDNVDELKLFKN